MYTRSSKYLFCLSTVLLVCIQTLFAAGSYVAPNYSDFDAQPPQAIEAGAPYISYTKFCFSSTFETSESLEATNPQGDYLFSSEINPMSTWTDEIDTPTYNFELDNMLAPGAGDVHLGSGFACAPYNQTEANNIRTLLYDLYPNTTNIVQQDNVYIAFKEFVNPNPPGTFHGLDPSTTVVNILLSGTVTESAQFRVNSTATNFVNPAVGNWTGVLITTGIDNNSSYGFVFNYNGKVPIGTTARVGIYVNRTSEFNGGQEQVTFNFSVEGIPFLQKIVSANTESGVDSIGTLKPVLYGWTISNKGDINGDGFDDFVVGDPYYKYSNSAYDSLRSGRAYVYFGGLDKIINSRTSPDLIINNYGTPNAVDASREFAYNVKLADVNGDGYADIIIGQPSYGPDQSDPSINKGRILIYYGGPKMADGWSLMNVNTPSIIIGNNTGTGGQYGGTADLFGEKFDVGDVNNDGCAEIIAKVSSNVYVINGSKIRDKLKNIHLDKYPVRLEASDPNYRDISIPTNYYDCNVAVVGDFDGDGYKDFVITYPRIDNGSQILYSAVEVYLGRADLRAINGPVTILKDLTSNNDLFGYSVAGADINGDGRTDIIVGKRTVGSDTGKVLIFMGKAQGDIPKPYYAYEDESSAGVICINDPMPRLYGNSPDNQLSQFGLSVAGVGNIDLDNDGCEDFMVGAPFYGDSDIGAVYIFLGAKFPDNTVGLDNLKKYVITGKSAYNHYGMEIANVGDFDGNGYPNVAIGAPGFQGNSNFAGYPSDESVVAVDNHYIDIFANTLAVDRELPILMSYRSLPADQTAGWDASGTVNFVLGDRGRAGLEFNTLQIKLFRNGLDSGEYVLSSKQSPANNGRIGLSSYFKLTDFWASENTTVGQDFSDLGQWSLSDYGTRIATQNNGYPLYMYQKDAKFIGVAFKPTQNYDLLRNADDYYYQIKIKDRGGDYMSEFAGPEREYTATVNFSTMQERYADIGTGNYQLSSTSAKTYKCIGDLDGDGVDDFAYSNPNKSNGEVYIYWGTSALNFAKNPDLILVNGDGVSKFGNYLGTLRMYESDRDDLIIGYDNGFYIITGYDCTHYDLRASSNYIVDMSKFNKVVTNGLPFAYQALKNKSRYHEALAVAHDNVLETYYFDPSSKMISSNSGIAISPNITMMGGYIRNSDVQNLIVGFPGYDNNRGRVKIFNFSNGVLNSTPVAQIANSTLEDAQFGFALSAGYFDTELNATGDPKVGTGYEDLAIGAPFASAFGPKAGLVIVVKGNGSLADMDVAGLTADKAYILKPESIYDRFGYSLASVKFMSTPEHYALDWGSDQYPNYYDDYDDLLAGAPGYDISLTLADTWPNSQGKIYVYRGGSDFSGKPNSGFLISQGVTKLGMTVGPVGDLLNVRNQIIAAGTDTDTKLFTMINNNIPDTIPPHIDMISPPDHEYEVPVTTSVTINVSDISGISDADLTIRRKINGNLVDLVANGQVVDAYSKNGNKYFKLQKNILTADGRSVQYVLSLDRGTLWNESEVVELEITVGDGRLVWKSATKRTLSPLLTKITTGFVAKYKENSAGIPYDFKGSDSPNSYFGENMCFVGDVNGDHMNDFIVGEYGNNDRGFNSGKAYLYLGNPDIAQFVKPAAIIDLGFGPDTETSARFGWKVAPAGDMNGDGYDDIAIVAANSSITGAEVFILYGNPDPRTTVSDLDRIRIDGAPLSYPWNNVYLSRYATCIEAAQAGDGLGNGIFGGGDINGDGYDDLVIGAPQYNEGSVNHAGRVFVIFGRKDMQGRNSRYVAGDYETVANIGPIRLDGVNWDMTTPTANAAKPVAGYLKNPNLLPTANAAFQDRFGSCILSNININGDTTTITQDVNGITVTRDVPLSEILVSAVGYSQGRGKVYMFSKQTEGDNWKLGLVNNTLVGDNPGDEFGFSLANLSDISADNNLGNKAGSVGQDFVVGAPGSNGSNPKYPKYEVGAAYVYLSTPNADGSFGFNVQRAMTAYGQNAGDQFGYAVSNVGNVNNNLYGNNNIAVGAPFYNINSGGISVPNGGRVYIFSTDLRNTGTDLAPNYQLILSSYPEFIAQGDLDTRFFGASLAYLGIIGNDFVPEYLVGAPGCSAMVNSLYTGNVGRVKMYTNPDHTPPDVVDPMSYLRPIPGDQEAVLKDFVGVLLPSPSGDVSVTVAAYNPISFRIHDDRAIKLESVMIEVDPQGKNDLRRYIFSPPKTGERYYTYINRKEADFFLYLKDNVYFDTTYNVRIFASDQKGNNLAYYYNPDPLPGFGPSTTNRIPLYSENPNWLDSHYKSYFEYKFYTAPSKGEGPAIEIAMDNDSNPNNTPLGYQGTQGYLTMSIADNKSLNNSSFSLEVSPSSVATNNAVYFAFGVTQNINLPGSKKYVFNDLLTLRDFPDGQKDGKYYLTAKATDSDGNTTVLSKMFIRDVEPPTVNPIFPAAGSQGNPDDCDISFKVVDHGTGVKLVDNYFAINYNNFTIGLTATSTTGNTRVYSVTSQNIDITYNMGLIPEDYATFIPEVQFNLKDFKFNYLDVVTVSVSVNDNAGHSTVYIYSYQVSPDYRPPFTRAGELPIIWESPYTTGNISVSVNAYDDVGVAGVLFEVNEISGEISGNSGLVTDNTLLNGTRQLFIPVTQNQSNGSVFDLVSNNYTGLYRLFVKHSAEATRLEDGTRRIKIKFLDAQGNQSKEVSADIIVDAVSEGGGPVMPIVMISNPANKPPLFDEMPRYINTRNVDVWVYATDLIITPNIPSGSPVVINPTVLGYVLGVEGYSGQAGTDTNKDIYRLKPYNVEENFVYDSRTKRSYLHIPNVDIGGSGEGSVKLIVNFADNDAGINLDKVIQGGTSTNRQIVFDDDYLLSPRFPTTNINGNIQSAAHPVNNLNPGMLDYLPTWNVIHFCDSPFVITFNYDTTPPSIDRVVARGGSTAGGANVRYKSSSYSRDANHLQLSVWYNDQWTAPNPAIPPVQYPLADLYYQIVCITGNTHMLVADVKGQNNFNHDAKTWYVDGTYKAYDGTVLDKDQMVYITPSDNNDTLDNDGRITNNTLELIVSGQTPGTTQSALIPAYGFVTDNVTASSFKDVNMQNWAHLDLNSNDVMNNNLDLELPVKLVAGTQGYYFRVCVKDRAGNYSPIQNSNVVNLDNASPKDPVYNYKPKIKLNKNKFSISFEDSDSGLAFIGFKLNPTDPYYDSIVYDGKSGITPNLLSFVTVNNQPVGDYIQKFTTNWAMPQSTWDSLPEAIQNNLFFKLDDAVAQTYETQTGSQFQFIKDTVSLTLTPNFSDALIIGTRNYTLAETVTINIGSQEIHVLGLTDLDLDSFLTANGTEFTYFKDFSFENAGDAENSVSQYLRMVSANDALVTDSIKLLESYPITGNNQIGSTITGKHYNGNYALAVEFNVPVINDEEQYVWQGLQVTVDVSPLTSTATTNFTVGVLLDTEFIATDSVDQGSGLGRPIGSGIRANNPANIGSESDGGFGLVLAAGNLKSVSKARINYYDTAARAGQKWTLITANIQIQPGTNTLTVNIMHLRQDSTATNPLQFEFNRLYQGLQGILLVDSLLVVPGNQVPNIFSSANSAEYVVTYNVVQGNNRFCYFGYDDMANVVTGAINIVRDNTPPTWNAPTFLTAPSENVVGLFTAAYQIATNRLLNGADGITVSVKTNAEGQSFINAFDRVSQKGYLAGYFQALDPETPIAYYEFEAYEVSPSGDTKIGGGEKNAQNRDIDTPLHAVNIDEQFDLRKGKAYYLRAQAINRLGYASDWISSNALIVDIDAPSISYQIQPSLIVTVNPGGSPEVTQNTGWYQDDIAVTLQARDMFMPDENNPGYLIPGGVGVQYIYLVTNNGVINRYDVSNLPSSSVFITFNLTDEGANSFKAWAEDQFGYKSKEISVTHNLNIDRSAPQAGFDFESGILSEADLSVIRWQNHPVGFDIKFSDACGVGTRELHWFIDDVEQSPFLLNFRPIGQAATINVVPRGSSTGMDVTIREGYQGGKFLKSLLAGRTDLSTLQQGGIFYGNTGPYYFWNANLADPTFLNDEELETALRTEGIQNIEPLVDIWRYETTERSIHYQTIDSNRFLFTNDGYHELKVYTVDKLGHTSPPVSAKYVCLDQGRPDVIINLGGSFQTEWSLQPITINLEAFDMFKDEVLVTNDYYDYTYVPSALQGLKVRRPGCGVKEVVITLNNTHRLPPLAFDGPAYRFGFTVNKFNNMYNNLDMSAMAITTNGVNIMTYQIVDNAGNASILTYWDGDPLKKFWNDTLKSYVYDGDNGVIRGIKVDTLPPYEPYLQILPQSYTDTLPGSSDYPLYTNKKDIQVRFGAKDDGIGVKYALVTALQNTVSSQNGLIDTMYPDPDNYLSPDSWIDISKLTGAAYKDPDNKEQGFLTYANYRKLRFGDLQGTRNIQVQYADDFGLDYMVSKASVEQRSSTYNPTDSVTTANMVPLEVYNTGAYASRADSNGAYFFWGGRFDVPTVNYGAGNRYTQEGTLLNQPGGYSFKEVYYGNGLSLNVYTWDETMPARFEHRGLTVNAVCTMNNANIIIYDNIVTKSIYEPVIVELATDTINGILQPFINRSSVTLKYYHDEQNPPELSGITDIMFGGDISYVKVSGNATTFNVNTWVPYKYRANVTNDYLITLKPPVQDGIITVNITGVRDRAGNIVSGSNLHTISFYYDRPMPWDNLNNRIVIRNADNSGAILKGAGQTEILLANAVNFKVDLDMFGADRYQFAEYLYGPNTINIVASGNYKELPDLAGTSKKELSCSLSAVNLEDGRKTIYVTLFDRGTGPSSSITVTYSYIADTTKPTINISGLDDKATKFYENFVTFSIYFSDLNPSADYVSGLQWVEYKINNNPFTMTNYSRVIIITANIANAGIYTSGLNNSVVCKACDKLGNESTVTINGIKLNANPPVIGAQVEVNASQGNNDNGQLFINTRTPNVKFTAYGNSDATLEVNGDISYVSNLNPFMVNMLNFTTDDGTKNITAVMRDSYTSSGGPSATRQFTFYLDTQKPSMSITNAVSSNINYIPDDMYVSGSVTDLPAPDYASGAKVYLYLNNDMVNVLGAEYQSENTWRVRVRDLIEMSNRREGVFVMKFFAKDRANNVSNGYQQVTFNLTSRYIKGGIQTNINSLDVNDISKDDNRIKIADGKLRGIKQVEDLNQTITDFEAKDASGNVVHNLQSVSGDIKIVIQYSAQSAEGIDPDNFKIYYLDEGKAEWVVVPGDQKVDKTARTVEAVITHLSIYRIFATVPLADNLKDVHVYPNPYHSGDDDKFNGEDGVQGYDKVTFENITNTAKVRIYTVSGELVNTLELKTGETQILWGLDNFHGQSVASGVYVILVTDEDNHRYVGRLTVIR